MAPRLIWSRRATSELQEIAAYIAKDAPNYSEIVVRRFLERGKLLLDQPQQGRRLPEYGGLDEMREVFVHRWRMIYEVTPDTVTILAILHGARLIENAPPL